MVQEAIDDCLDTVGKVAIADQDDRTLRLGTGAVAPILPSLAELEIWDSQLNHSFLESFLEAFSEGILVFDLSGALLYVNEAACGLLKQATSTYEQQRLLEREIRALYRLMVEQSTDRIEAQTSLDEIPLRSVEAEVMLSLNMQLRIHVRRFQVCTYPDEMVWVRLEDRQQLSRARALLESRWYGLSEREGEVWQLRQAGFTYAEVAQRLFITVNTVKKHVRNIRAKRELYYCQHSVATANG
ncbi:helix-turn-helix transcriptional regulator [Leptolyngbya cf. ectocarpi LEGE 11479]|uniref:Helix-turn-helix transcriptional regulator n=1 Tax=Leptolyngbya cf. ectocarpi LEGE 11479 TaxID=1828722 RepID=A0A928ZZQ0_LEPEC|nr:helix-turn-helix transcriptional regulator [Leptolyngbya ectocarpi]MBE9070484.1 helix-turn-helix transcriptional regulator [Leptolyngbya cf. ectocarpi LEGE 11479]